MRLFALLSGALLLSACYGPGGAVRSQRARPNMGQYQRPLYLQPQPTRRIPEDDLCSSRLFLGLVGQHEGSIVFATLPGRTRVIKPAELELDLTEAMQDLRPDPPFVRVREFVSGQTLYSPSINAVQRTDTLGPVVGDRLTVELDREGYVRELNCS